MQQMSWSMDDIEDLRIMAKEYPNGGIAAQLAGALVKIHELRLSRRRSRSRRKGGQSVAEAKAVAFKDG